MAEQMVRHALHVVQGWPRRQHAQHVVDLHGIRIDHHAVIFPGDAQRQRRLAARGGSGYQGRVFAHEAGIAMFVATLIANPAEPVLTPELAHSAMRALGATQLYWLADGVACDIPVKQAGKSQSLLAEALIGQPVDCAIQRQEGRRKKMLIADMDSTMIEQECIDELAGMIGLKDKVAAITARAMNGEIAFEPALRERVALLKGLPVEVVQQVIEEKITLMPGGRALVRTMRKNGAYTALVSGGFTAFTGPIAAAIGFDENRANELLSENGLFTGKVAEPILGKEAKLHALNEICRPHRHFRAGRHRRRRRGERPFDAASGWNGRRAARQTVGVGAGENQTRFQRLDRASLPAGIPEIGVSNMIVAEIERLILRNWEERDREMFHELNSDDIVMEFFPFRRTRQEADERLNLTRASIENVGFRVRRRRTEIDGRVPWHVRHRPARHGAAVSARHIRSRLALRRPALGQGLRHRSGESGHRRRLPQPWPLGLCRHCGQQPTAAPSP